MKHGPDKLDDSDSGGARCREPRGDFKREWIFDLEQKFFKNFSLSVHQKKVSSFKHMKSTHVNELINTRTIFIDFSIHFYTH